MKNLRFFNKEGYPYNFQFDDSTEMWSGKMLFDPNSSDVYKTIGMYIFENVEPIELSSNFTFDKIELFNNSGISFNSETIQNSTIINITKVNNSSTFFTKWIHGNNFHQLYPVGTIVKLKSVIMQNSNDFLIDTYYNVIAVKNNAFMIQTITSNNIYNGNYISSGYVTSYNVIKYPDYNQNLTSSLTSKLYTNKKLSIINSNNNDGIINLDKYITYNRDIYNYNISSGIIGQYLNLEITSFIDRPLLYSGGVTVSGTTFTFDQPFKNNISVGSNIIFEDINGYQLLSGNQYTVTNILTEKYIATTNVNFYINDTEYFCEFNNISYNLNVNDIIYFSGNTLNTNKDFKILNIKTNSASTILQLEQLVHVETVNIKIIKKLKFYDYDTIKATGTSVSNLHFSGNTFLTTNIKNFKQEILSNSALTVDAFVTNNNFELNRYGVNCYNKDNKLVIEGLYEYSGNTYFKSKLMINNSNTIINSLNSYSNLSGRTTMHYLITSNKLYSENIRLYENTKLAKTYHEEIYFQLNNDINNYGFTLNINDIEYYISYQISTQQTIINFINTYHDALYNTGINIYSGTTTDQKLYINTLYPNVIITKLSVNVNVYSTYNIININSNSLLIDPIIISGNQMKLINSATTLFNYGLSTGMIISVTGNTYNENQKEYNIVGLSKNIIQLSYQGAFFNDINKNVIISSREYIRKPRISYNTDIYYKISWINTADNIYDSSMFFYDISGDQISTKTDSMGNSIPSLEYTGIKPLFDESEQNIIRLNSEPNNKLEYVNNPKYQQTVFDSLNFLLPQLDSNDDFNYLPEPFQVFIGYNNPDEGVNINTMIIEKIENIIFSGTTGVADNYFMFDGYLGTITFKSNSFSNFENYNFEIGQLIQITMKDTSTYNQVLFENYDTYKIINIKKNVIYIDLNDITSTFKTFISNVNNKIFNYQIKVVPKIIGQFTIYGECEIEDERFDVNLRNLGININKEEETIFAESDINEFGIDYELLNTKRKEMLLLYPEIYNYIGSYKSLINSINYFGFPDLELYEYYRNVNMNSPLYKKLVRVHIPDMFDLSTEGWSEYDYIKTKGNKNNYKKTNLFNLTYNITDNDGNNLNLYSLNEVQIKLQKLKVWLRNNILPLGTNIVDISGSAKILNTNYYQHQSSQIIKFSSSVNCEIVNFNYLATLAFSSNYLVNINFYTVSGNIPESFELIIKTFSKDDTGKLIPVQYYKMLRTDLNSFNISIDKNIDPYIYIETTNYSDSGLAQKNHKLFVYNELTSYTLVNNNFKYGYTKRISTLDKYYILDKGQIWEVKNYAK